MIMITVKEDIEPDEYKTKLSVGNKFAITLDDLLCIEIIKNPDGYLINNWRCPSADNNDLLYSNEIKNKVLNKFEEIHVIQT